MATAKTKRQCSKGHTYYKSSDCPVCPICAQENKPKEGFLNSLAAPARRALENKGITTVEKLATYTQEEILALHGMGKSSLPKLEAALNSNNLHWKKQADEKE